MRYSSQLSGPSPDIKPPCLPACPRLLRRPTGILSLRCEIALQAGNEMDGAWGIAVSLVKRWRGDTAEEFSEVVEAADTYASGGGGASAVTVTRDR